jgi:hypothetical protein
MQSLTPDIFDRDDPVVVDGKLYGQVRTHYYNLIGSLKTIVRFSYRTLSFAGACQKIKVDIVFKVLQVT